MRQSVFKLDKGQKNMYLKAGLHYLLSYDIAMNFGQIMALNISNFCTNFALPS